MQAHELEMPHTLYNICEFSLSLSAPLGSLPDSHERQTKAAHKSSISTNPRSALINVSLSLAEAYKTCQRPSPLLSPTYCFGTTVLLQLDVITLQELNPMCGFNGSTCCIMLFI